jgi:hypothetical protein
MDRCRRLLEITQGAVFPPVSDCKSPDELLKIGKQNIAIFDRIAALGQDRIERMMNLISGELAEAFQPRAIKAYGDYSKRSIRQLLMTMVKANGEKGPEPYIELAKEGASREGLSREQLELVYRMFDLLPRLVFDMIVELSSRFRLIKAENVPQIALTLNEMFQEANNVNESRHN